MEGIDQSGKRTQTRLLARHLRQIGARTATISFPIYESPSGRDLREYLKGKRNYPPEALHMLYSLNRWENQTLIRRLVEKTEFVIADRYTPSNLAYGVSRGLNLTWLRGLDEGLPPADLVIVLNVPVYSSFSRKSTNRDVHESDKKLLARVSGNYRVLARKLGWKRIDATGPIAAVHGLIWNTVLRRFSLVKTE